MDDKFPQPIVAMSLLHFLNEDFEGYYYSGGPCCQGDQLGSVTTRVMGCLLLVISNTHVLLLLSSGPCVQGYLLGTVTARVMGCLSFVWGRVIIDG